jgi:hypothetical protein
MEPPQLGRELAEEVVYPNGEVDNLRDITQSGVCCRRERNQALPHG